MKNFSFLIVVLIVFLAAAAGLSSFAHETSEPHRDPALKNTTVETASPEPSPATNGDPDDPVIEGRITDDDNDGVVHAEIQDDVIDARDGDDDATVKEGGNNSHTIHMSAIEVRGWDAEKKEAFLQTVKAHAQVRSEQDLENFATGILLRDENVSDIETDDSSVEMEYRVPAKLFGFIPTGLPVRAKVDVHAQERVKVRFPWYRFLFGVPDELKADTLEGTILPEIGDEVLVAFEQGDEGERNSIRARTMQILSSVLKASHEAAI